jgi:hypothetical protein
LGTKGSRAIIGTSGTEGDVMNDVTEWITGAEAAEILGVGRTTVYRSLNDPAERERQWGTEGEGWRYKPLTRRRIFQVSRERARQLASGAPR